MVIISNGHLNVEISTAGAELQSVIGHEGQSWLWSGDPAFWSGRAPILFPVVGRSPNGQTFIDGHHYPMEGHGFARTSQFQIVEMTGGQCVMRLHGNDNTRRSFPFAFQLDIVFRLNAVTLSVEAHITNRDLRPMPFCFGFHPAFAWPLPDSKDRPHLVLLEQGREPEVMRLDAEGLLVENPTASPFKRGRLTLSPDQFDAGALIFSDGAGHRLWYGAEGRAGIQLDFPKMPQLGIWTKPGAPFLCLEPWHGLPAPADAEEPLATRRGSINLVPGETSVLDMQITFGIAAPAGLS